MSFSNPGRSIAISYWVDIDHNFMIVYWVLTGTKQNDHFQREDPTRPYGDTSSETATSCSMLLCWADYSIPNTCESNDIATKLQRLLKPSQQSHTNTSTGPTLIQLYLVKHKSGVILRITTRSTTHCILLRHALVFVYSALLVSSECIAG